MDLDLLIKKAEDAMEKAYAPYSNFRVGAVVKTEGGGLYSGCNFESASGSLSICAEKLAILKALSEGERSLKMLLIVSSTDEYCFPCGSCRQIIFDISPECELFLVSSKGIKKFMPSELLPYPFVRFPKGRQ